MKEGRQLNITSPVPGSRNSSNPVSIRGTKLSNIRDLLGGGIRREFKLQSPAAVVVDFESNKFHVPVSTPVFIDTIAP